MTKVLFDRFFDYYGKKKCMGRKIEAFVIDLDFIFTDRHGRKEHAVSLTEYGAPSVFAAAVNRGLICRLSPLAEEWFYFIPDESWRIFYENNEITVEYVPVKFYVVVRDEDGEEPEDGNIHIGERLEVIPVEKALFISLVKDAFKNDEIATTGRYTAFSNE